MPKNKRAFPGGYPKLLEAAGTGHAWHNGGGREIALYAQSLRKAARILMRSLPAEANPNTEWDGWPAFLVYRQAIELHMKAVIEEGNHFVKTPTDAITLHKTHSVRWLAQIICQIIKAVRWESQFQCKGIVTLAAFGSVIAELEAVDPVEWAIVAGRSPRDGSPPPQLSTNTISSFAMKLDALLDLLEWTAESLALIRKRIRAENQSDLTSTIQ